MGSLSVPFSSRIKVIKKEDGSFEINTIEFIQELNNHLQSIYQEASTGWAVTNKTEDRTLDSDCDDALVLGDVLGTLIDDLIKKGILSS